MAKINVESGGAAPLSTGELQLNNGVAMSTTLTAVTDQNNTASQLKLASNLTQVAGTLQIQTDTATYIDVEDGSGNNRFTVSRQPASQQVSVDFASVPTDLTTVVGAIRTATNGSTLANIVSFTEAGNVGFGTDTPGTKVDIHSANNTVAQFNRTGTGNSQIQHLMTGTARWTTGYVNATGNYSIFDNVNSVFRTNLSNTGKLTIGNGDTALTGQLNVKGSGSTSATTSFLVQNSAGTQLGYIDDSGQWQIGTGTNGGYALDINGNSRTRGYLFFGTAGSFLYGDTNNIRLYDKNNVIILQSFPNGVANSETYLQSSSGNKYIKLNDNGINLEWFNSSTGNSTQKPFNIIRGFFSNVGATDKTVLNITTPFFSNLTNATTLTGILIDINDTTTYTGFTTVRAIQAIKGGAYFNTTTPQASSVLQADSTTQGFLPPRMTNAQRLAISTPAVGLMVYCTDAVEGLYVYKSTGWTFVI